MTPNEKIETAKRLLREASDTLRAQAYRERLDAYCGCGHTREQHSVSTSINYTGGFCNAKRCNCKWFMQREAPHV